MLMTLIVHAIDVMNVKNRPIINSNANGDKHAMSHTGTRLR